MKNIYLLLYLSIFLCLGFSTCRSNQIPEDTEFVIANGADTAVPDPAYLRGREQKRVASALFEGLVTPHPVTGRPVPGAAESWAAADGDTEIVFTLRECVWSDGVPVTADTFVESWERTRTADPLSSNAAIIEEIIASATARDDYTLEVNSRVSPAALLNALADPVFSPVPVHLIEKYGSGWTDVDIFSGNGAFLPLTYIPSEKLVVTANPMYWDRGHLKLKKIVFLAEGDLSGQLYDSHSVDWIPSGVSTLTSAGGEDLVIHPFAGVAFFRVNMTKSPFDNRNTRALFLSEFRRSRLLSPVPGSRYLPARTLIPDMSRRGGKSSEKTAKDDTRDRRPKGTTSTREITKVKIYFSASPVNRVLSASIEGIYAHSDNFRIESRELVWQEYMSTGTDEFHLLEDLLIFRWGDPAAVLLTFTTGAPENRGGYSNPDFDTLVGNAMSMDDSPERTALLKEAEDLLLHDAAAVPLYFPSSANRIDMDKWKGWYPNYQDLHPLKYLRLKDGRE